LINSIWFRIVVRQRVPRSVSTEYVERVRGLGHKGTSLGILQQKQLETF